MELTIVVRRWSTILEDDRGTRYGTWERAAGANKGWVGRPINQFDNYGDWLEAAESFTI